MEGLVRRLVGLMHLRWRFRYRTSQLRLFKGEKDGRSSFCFVPLELMVCMQKVCVQ